MKLRNKNTGDAVYVDFQIPLSNNNDVVGYYSVTSLKELNESFEDYKPTEPLIKDEKIRKAVRAWADNLRAVMCDGEIRFYVDEAYCTFQTDVWRKHNTRDIAELDLVMNLDHTDLEDGTTYTIAELCGEEEE